MDTEDIDALYDDLNLITEEFEHVLLTIETQKLWIGDREEEYDRLSAENEELTQKILELKTTATTTASPPKSRAGFGFGSSSSSLENKGTYECVLKNLDPYIERAEIRNYFEEYGNVAHVVLTPDGVERWRSDAADAIISFIEKPDELIFSICHTLRERHVEILPKEEVNAPAQEPVSEEETAAAVIPVSKVPAIASSTDPTPTAAKLMEKTSCASSIASSGAASVGCKRSRSVMVNECGPSFLSDIALHEFFSKFGRIVKCTHPYNSKAFDKHRYVFIKFETYESAAKVMQLGNFKIGLTKVWVRYGKDV